MTAVATHELTVAVLLLERHPNIRSWRFFQHNLGGASLSALAQMSNAQWLSCQNKLAATGALNGAIESPERVIHLIRVACARCYVRVEGQRRR
jgi:hypothetical protein